MKDSTLDAYRAVALAKAGLGVERWGVDVLFRQAINGRFNFRDAADEFCRALELARGADLWRFDAHWRHVIARGAPV